MRRRLIGAAFALLAVTGTGLVTSTGLAHAAAVTDLYVNARSGCSDSGAGDQNVPFCTVQAAANSVQPGQTVHIQALADDTEDYAGAEITRSGTPGAPITFVGEPDNGELPFVGVDSAHGFDIEGASNIVISDIGTTGSDGGVLVNNSSQIAISGVRIADGQGAAAIDLTGNTTDVTISRTYGQAPQSFGAISIGQGVSHTTVTDNDLEWGGGPVVQATDASNTVVTGNTFYKNCGPGVDLEGNSTNSTIENNIITGFDSTQSNCDPTPIVVSAGSTTQTTADYNLIYGASFASGQLYDWAGTSYATIASFTTATGQGAHDINADPAFASDDEEAYGNRGLAEHSPAIDSADAAAPGELSTDLLGKPRVDDTLVPNTGTGSGIVDRGAFELQDPFFFGGVSATPTKGPFPLVATATAQVTNAWGEAVSYSFDFGDGTAPVVTTNPTATHTYTAASNGADTITVTATTQNKAVSSNSTTIQVVPPTPFVATLHAYQTYALSATADASQSTDDWAITNYSFDFGDGTAPVSGTDPSENHAYPKPGTYTVGLTMTDSTGATRTASQQITVGEAFTDVGTQRVLDTRNGTGAPTGKVGPGGRLVVHVDDASPSATSVAIDVTATDATTNSFLTVYADGTPMPTLSSVNFGAGQTIRNLITVPIGTDGDIDIVNNAGSTDVVADVEGYYSLTTSDLSGATFFAPVKPYRQLDTRNGTGMLPAFPVAPISPGSPVLTELPTSLQNSDVAYVVLNVTVTNATTSGNLSINDPAPQVNTEDYEPVLSFAAGQTISNTVIMSIQPNDYALEFFNDDTSGTFDVVADVEGYYYPNSMGLTPLGTTGSFTQTNPTRVLDTRNGTGGVPTAPVGPNSDLALRVAGINGVPADATSVVLNVTDVNPTAAGYLTISSSPGAGPTSNLHFAQGQILSDQVMVPVGPGGKIYIHNYTGSTDLVAGLSGYFQPSSA
ncbi:MAG TPA: PKD domain-containing protein [Pseudonocardiaceae bacterium]|nr:PKD domain-containing protein [Pseudonocardiaceae bacterium]